MEINFRLLNKDGVITPLTTVKEKELAMPRVGELVSLHYRDEVTKFRVSGVLHQYRVNPDSLRVATPIYTDVILQTMEEK